MNSSNPLPARLHLANTPTPLQKMERLSRDIGVAIYFKRDDFTGSELSGNKVRKLEYLLAEAQAGRPRLCQSCHADPALGAEGDPDRLNLAAAVHGFHAHHMAGQNEEACATCHPARRRVNRG